MQGFTRTALQLVPGFLVIGLVTLSQRCLAQEVEAPGAGGEAGSVFAPSGYVQLLVPLQERTALSLYGFYIGELKTPGVLVEVPIRTTTFLTITPSYQYLAMPPSGLDQITEQGVFSDTYKEHQFRVDGTFKFHIHKLEIYDRNMYVRRFRPSWAGDDIDRYRNRLAIAYPIPIRGIWKPFASYEGFFEPGHSGATRTRLWIGVTLPLREQVWFQPSYVWDNNRVRGLRDVNYLLFALIVRPG